MIVFLEFTPTLLFKKEIKDDPVINKFLLNSQITEEAFDVSKHIKKYTLETLMSKMSESFLEDKFSAMVDRHRTLFDVNTNKVVELHLMCFKRTQKNTIQLNENIIKEIEKLGWEKYEDS